MTRLPIHLQMKIEPEPMSGCWIWTGARNVWGYGVTAKKPGLSRLAHRAIYALLRTPPPAGMDTDHLCRVRACVNPAHLEIVTRQVNLARGRHTKREKTHCPQGHPYDAENTYQTPGKIGRWCRICGRQRTQAWYRKQLPLK